MNEKDNRNDIAKKTKNKFEKRQQQIKFKKANNKVPVIRLFGSTILVIMQSSGVAVHVDISE
jgi:hypothetical protein